jgi:hypothetical protein
MWQMTYPNPITPNIQGHHIEQSQERLIQCKTEVMSKNHLNQHLASDDKDKEWQASHK